MGGDIDRWGVGDLVVWPPNQLDLSMLLLGQPGVGTSTAAEQITHLAAQENRQVVAIDGKGEEDFAAGIIALNLTARPDARIGLLPATLRPLALVAGRAGRLPHGAWSFTQEAEFQANIAQLALLLATSAPGHPPIRSAAQLVERRQRIRPTRIVPIYGELEALGWTSTAMTLTEQVAQLRELARLSSGTRMLDVLIINILDELAQAVGRLEPNEPPGSDKVQAEVRGWHIPDD